MWVDESGKRLDEYERPSVAVDTAVLSVSAQGTLDVLLVRRAPDRWGGEWALPGTFLHQGETLADAVLRSLHDKAGARLPATPRQLHVFDDPERDYRGWVLSVAHLAVVRRAELETVLASSPDGVRAHPVAGVAAVRLPFGHDLMVERAVQALRETYAEQPDPEHLLDDPLTMPGLRALHEAIAGTTLHPDNFRRLMEEHLVDTGEVRTGVVGRPAKLYRRPPRTEG